MAGRIPSPPTYRRIVKLHGEMLRCQTDLQIVDGKVKVKIDQVSAAPIANLITLSSMGIRYEDMQYLVAEVDVSDVFKPYYAYAAWKRKRLGERLEMASA